MRAPVRISRRHLRLRAAQKTGRVEPDNGDAARAMYRPRLKREMPDTGCPSLSEALPAALRRTLLLGAALAVAAAVIWYAGAVLLYAFAGILVAVVLQTCAHWVSEKAHLGPRVSYWCVLIGVAGIAAAVVWLIAPRVESEGADLITQLPAGLARLRESIGNTSLGASILHLLQQRAAESAHRVRLASMGSSALDTLGGAIVALVVGLYGAADPDLYRAGLLRIIPQPGRAHAAKYLDRVTYTLRWWMFGQMVPMVVLALATMLGLWLMDIPLAFTLGLFTGLMIFIPYVGSLIAAIPTALIALLQSPMKMVWVLLLYICVHVAEGYALTPLVQRRAVRLPPVVTVLAQLLMWSIAGVLGAALATPLAAAALTVVSTALRDEKEPA